VIRLGAYAAAGALMIGLVAPALGQEVSGQTVIDFETRPGVTTRYLTLAPAQPRAAVLLFTGGQGVANIPDRPGPGWARQGAFVVRARALFRDHGLFVAVIDAPSDHRDGLGPFRNTAEHAQDVASVIADIRKRTNGLPVWLIGTSRGTLSAANAATRLEPPQAADGLVLTSTVTRPAGRQSGPGGTLNVFDMSLSRIRIPTLIVHHRSDGCRVTPAADVGALREKLTGAPRTEVMMFSGGDPPRSDACEALSEHGFLGIEAQVVEAIAAWILKGNA
jgi:pimeloyl-ACP methyl ester carboxylesterase